MQAWDFQQRGILWAYLYFRNNTYKNIRKNALFALTYKTFFSTLKKWSLSAWKIALSFYCEGTICLLQMQNSIFMPNFIAAITFFITFSTSRTMKKIWWLLGRMSNDKERTSFNEKLWKFKHQVVAKFLIDRWCASHHQNVGTGYLNKIQWIWITYNTP